jgi:hypothetical protein
MKLEVYNAHRFKIDNLLNANCSKHMLLPIKSNLNAQTVTLVSGCNAVSVFINDEVSRNTEITIHNLYCFEQGIRSEYEL